LARDVVAAGRLGAPPEGARVRVIDLDARVGNVSLGLEDLWTLAGAAFGARHLELVEAAATIQMGDAALPRGRAEAWSRDVSFHLAASPGSPLHALTGRLAQCLEFVLGDRVTVYATDAGFAAPCPDRRQAAVGVDCVCLLSGGLDSLAGAVALLESGRKPLLLSHETGNPVTHASRAHARQCLAERYGPLPSASVRLAASGRRRARWPYPTEGEQEPSRRSRSLVPLTAAAAVADALDLDEIWIPENGVMAAQPPLTRARVGAFTTRTAHPRWLQGLEGLFSDYFGRPMRIVNPLIGSTKSEVVGHILLRHLDEAAVRGTDSCWAAGRGALPCGGCVPCLIRRFAFAEWGLAPEATITDPLTDPDRGRGSESYANLMALLGFVSDILSYSREGFYRRCPELAYLGAGHVHTYEVLRRFASEITRVCRREYPEAWDLAGVSQ